MAENMFTSAQRGRDIPVTHAADPDTVIAEQLAHSNQVLRECWRVQRDRELAMPVQLDVLKVAARLMKINLRQAEALRGRPREFVHRIIVEHVGERTIARTLAHAPANDAHPESADAPSPPPSEILKTIRRVVRPIDPQDIEPSKHLPEVPSQAAAKVRHPEERAERAPKD